MTESKPTTLADRVERAEGPSRELDAEIENLLAGGSAADLAYVLTDIERSSAPQPYTASLDAALTLVPVDPEIGIWRWILTQPGYIDGVYQEGRSVARIHHPASSGGGPRYDATGATPALALTAAVLRARARAGEE